MRELPGHIPSRGGDAGAGGGGRESGGRVGHAAQDILHVVVLPGRTASNGSPETAAATRHRNRRGQTGSAQAAVHGGDQEQDYRAEDVHGAE